jgi:ubiquinone/menaquinone biosynthesis C-methylase UbiE
MECEISKPDTNKIRRVWQNKTLKKVFLDIISNTQLHKSKQVKRLIVRYINELLSTNAGIQDEEIYAKLFAYVHCELSKDLSSKIQHKEHYRVQNRASKIANFVAQYGNGLKAQSVLDIGCDDGSITDIVGNLLQLPPEAIHGCDVVPIVPAPSKFTFHQSTSNHNVLPFTDCQHDLIYAFMSIHHIQDCPSLLREVYRTLKPGGLFVIREHDCSPTMLPGYSDVLDIMHGFYSMVWSNPQEKKYFKDEYFAQYWSASALNSCIEGIGFKKLLNTSRPNERFPQFAKGKVINPLKYYYAVYRK